MAPNIKTEISLEKEELPAIPPPLSDFLEGEVYPQGFAAEVRQIVAGG